MATTSRKCINIGNCDIADRKQLLNIAIGQDNFCPECGKELQVVQDLSKKRNPFLYSLLVIVPVLLIGGLFWLWPTKTDPPPCDNPPCPTPTPNIPRVSPTRPPVTPMTESNSSLPPAPPKAPNRSESVLRAVVEVGATGFNHFIVRTDSVAPTNGYRTWGLDAVPVFDRSYVFDQMATEAQIRPKLKDKIDKILDFGVRGKDVHFIISSGAIQEPVMQKIASVLKSDYGYVVNTITPAQEAIYALKSLATRERERDSLFVDIGTSNTKIAWVDNQGTFQTLDSYGAGFPKKNVKEEDVLADLRSKLSRIPSTRNRYTFIIGGFPFSLVEAQKEDRRYINNEFRYSKLNSPNFYESQTLTDKQRAGMVIYKAIADSTGCNNFIFDWGANFSIGFLLSLP